MVHERPGGSRKTDGVDCCMPGVCARLATVNMLGIDWNGEMVAERVEVDIGGGDADGHAALLHDLFGDFGDHVGAVAHPFPVRFEVDEDQGRCHNNAPEQKNTAS